MKSLLLGLLSLATPLLAVQVGDTAESVVAEKGKPTSTLNKGEITLLTYPDAKIQIKGGKVISVQAPSKDYVVKTAPKTNTNKPAGGTAQESTGVQLPWTTDLTFALQAATPNRKVLVFFTGSDWCSWCKRTDEEIFSTYDFLEYAQSDLILVKVDFPRKTQLPDFQKKQNAELARGFGIRYYPTIIVLNPKGRELARLGYREGGPGPFIELLKTLKAN